MSGAAAGAGGEGVSPSGPGGSATPPGLLASQVERSAAVSQLVSNRTFPAGDAAGVAGRDPAQSVSEQIRDSLYASLDRGERQVVIRLHPPELGSVLVRLHEQNEQIQGVLEVSRSDTRHEVEQALPQVLRDLQDLGVQIRKFDVTVSGQSDHDAGRQPLHQDAWPQQQGSDRPTNQVQRPAFEFRVFDPESATLAGTPPAGRIDMLA
jgi:flagellar hook-length control protein FliK